VRVSIGRFAGGVDHGKDAARCETWWVPCLSTADARDGARCQPERPSPLTFVTAVSLEIVKIAVEV
jgi:hypothetical protein